MYVDNLHVRVDNVHVRVDKVHVDERSTRRHSRQRDGGFLYSRPQYIDKEINFCHLKGILEKFVTDFFQKDIETRFRPSYFPFTEPSAELDIKFRGKWLEVLGCGMVHDNVLKNVSINSKIFSGFAFGLGIERFAMLKFDIRDLRSFYENDLSFLKQFKGIS